MSETESTEPTVKSGCSTSSEDDFERLLDEATRFYHNGDFEEALKILSCLEVRFGRYLRLLPLLGDVLMTVGEEHRGLRYKVLYGMLLGALNQMEDSSKIPISPPRRLSGGPLESRVAIPQGADEEQPAPIPPTISMGRLFMRQGHYEKALAIFEDLLVNSPDDDVLRELRDRAKKKLRDSTR